MMDSHLFEEEEEVSYLDIMSTREHMEYILNYPDKPLISTRFKMQSTITNIISRYGNCDYVAMFYSDYADFRN